MAEHHQQLSALEEAEEGREMTFVGRNSGILNSESGVINDTPLSASGRM